MFWIEEADDKKSFVLFGQVSLDNYSDELEQLGGLYLEKVQSRSSGLREGWAFAVNLREQIDAFIERELNDVRSNSSEGLTLEDLYDLLLEAFDRIATLEKKVGVK